MLLDVSPPEWLVRFIPQLPPVLFFLFTIDFPDFLCYFVAIAATFVAVVSHLFPHTLNAILKLKW